MFPPEGLTCVSTKQKTPVALNHSHLCRIHSGSFYLKQAAGYNSHLHKGVPGMKTPRA